MLGRRQNALAQRGINHRAEGEGGREPRFLRSSVQGKCGWASCTRCLRHPDSELGSKSIMTCCRVPVCPNGPLPVIMVCPGIACTQHLQAPTTGFLRGCSTSVVDPIVTCPSLVPSKDFLTPRWVIYCIALILPPLRAIVREN